jgi:hypothetical protein
LFGNWKERKCTAFIEGIGYATVLEHIFLFLQQLVFKIDENGLENTKLSDIDVIVMHAPGTIKGDLVESNSIFRYHKGTTEYKTSSETLWRKPTMAPKTSGKSDLGLSVGFD